jgi:hypothetical protein
LKLQNQSISAIRDGKLTLQQCATVHDFPWKSYPQFHEKFQNEDIVKFSVTSHERFLSMHLGFRNRQMVGEDDARLIANGQAFSSLSNAGHEQ